MSSTKFRLSERLQWYEFIICLLIFFVPITILCVADNLYPDHIAAPVAITVITAALLLSIISVALRKRGRILVSDGSKWIIKHEKSGKPLMEFDFSLPHSFMVAIRQGITGKYGKTTHRWLQVFLAQNGKILRIEAPYMESIVLKGNTPAEWCSQIGIFTNPLLELASRKSYTYDETDYFREKKQLGNAIHGLSDFFEGLSEELIKVLFEVVDNSSGQNIFLAQMSKIRGDKTAFSVFKKEFIQTVQQI